FIGGLYLDLLNRAPTAADLTYWVNVKTASDTNTVAYDFLTSPELRRRFTDAAFHAYFSQGADTTALNTWVTDSFNFTQLREGLLSTLRYYDERKAYATPVAFPPSRTAVLQGQSFDLSDRQFFSVVVGTTRILAVNAQT